MREKNKMTVKRLATILIAVLVVITSIGLDPQEVSAAKKSQNRIEFKTSTYNLYVGEYASITVDKVYCGGDCTYNSKAVKKAVSKKEFNYTSSNNAVQVSKTGVITVKGKHDATITVTSKYSSAVKGKIKVNVTKKAQKNAKLQLQSKKATIGVNKTKQIKVKTLTGVSNKNKTTGVKFSTSDKKIATVTSKGVVTGKKKGTATITVTSKVNKNVKAIFKVTVESDDLLKTTVSKKGKAKITLAKTQVTLAPAKSFDVVEDLISGGDIYSKYYIGDTEEKLQKNHELNDISLSALIMLKNKEKYGTAQIKIASITGLKNSKVSYKSSDTSVATVANTGLVTPKKAGHAKIYVRSKANTSVYATYDVYVENLATSIQFYKYTNIKKSWSRHSLSVEVLPSSAANRNFTLTSSNEDVIVVDGDEVIGVGYGKAKLTLQSADKKVTYSWTCTVSDKNTIGWGWEDFGY